MKTITNTVKKLSIIATAVAAFSANAILLTDNDTTDFTFGGDVAQQCKVSSSLTANAGTLDLTANAQTQDVATVSVWCNIAQNAVTTYSSANSGNLLHSNGTDSIGYTFNVSGTTTANAALTGDVTVDQNTGSGRDGSHETSTVSITPSTNGFEFAGAYSDTITVTVSPE